MWLLLLSCLVRRFHDQGWYDARGGGVTFENAGHNFSAPTRVCHQDSTISWIIIARASFRTRTIFAFWDEFVALLL